MSILIDDASKNTFYPILFLVLFLAMCRVIITRSHIDKSTVVSGQIVGESSTKNLEDSTIIINKPSNNKQ
jgi:hypothetical protein